MRIRLDRTMCDGFGVCAKHAASYFSLDDWGYATLVGDGGVPEEDRPAVTRALLDCPVHAIVELTDQTSAPQPDTDTDTHETEWGIVR